MDKNILKITTTILCSIGIFMSGNVLAEPTKTIDGNTATIYNSNGEPVGSATATVNKEDGVLTVTGSNDGAIYVQRPDEQGVYVGVVGPNGKSGAIETGGASVRISGENGNVTVQGQEQQVDIYNKNTGNGATVAKNEDGSITATSSQGTATRNGTTTTVTKDGVTKSFDNSKKPTRPRKNK